MHKFSRLGKLQLENNENTKFEIRKIANSKNTTIRNQTVEFELDLKHYEEQ